MKERKLYKKEGRTMKCRFPNTARMTDHLFLPLSNPPPTEINEWDSRGGTSVQVWLEVRK